MSQDAADFSPFANPIARTKAQQAYWQALVDLRKMEIEERRLELEESQRGKSATSNGSGGVLVVPGLMSGQSWEQVAAEAQDALNT